MLACSLLLFVLASVDETGSEDSVAETRDASSFSLWCLDTTWDTAPKRGLHGLTPPRGMRTGHGPPSQSHVYDPLLGLTGDMPPVFPTGTCTRHDFQTPIMQYEVERNINENRSQCIRDLGSLVGIARELPHNTSSQTTKDDLEWAALSGNTDLLCYGTTRDTRMGCVVLPGAYSVTPPPGAHVTGAGSSYTGAVARGRWWHGGGPGHAGRARARGRRVRRGAPASRPRCRGRVLAPGTVAPVSAGPVGPRGAPLRRRRRSA